MISDMTAPEPPKYFTLYAVSEGENFTDYYDVDAINRSLSEESREYLYDGGIIWTWDRLADNTTWDYTGNFGIESFPTFLVFDTDELILKTTDINEVDTFLTTNKPDWRE